MTKVLIAIVDKGQAEEVISITKRCGAKGGSVIPGKGASVFEKKDFFGIEIEPEKDVVIVVTGTEKAKTILQVLTEELCFNKPNTGVAFLLNTTEVIGVVEE